MPDSYQHLGVYSDWVAAAQRQASLFPVAPPGAATQRRVREVLGFTSGPEIPRNVQVEQRWTAGDVAGEEISWSVGYGPRTHAYLLKPAAATGPLPGIVALHDHGGFKYYGKEKIADGPGGPAPGLAEFRERYYGGRAYANALAQAGFVVLVPDCFLWGSRRFPLATMIAGVGDRPPWPDYFGDVDVAINHYNAVADPHEHMVAKYCNLLGTSLPGVVSCEDRIALNYLLSRPDVQVERIGVLGLSGGGNRTALLNATHDGVAAAAIVGLMSTYPGLLDHNMSHSWLFFPYNWSRFGDWPDLAACRAPSPLLVQYDLADELFTPEGMDAAHARLQEHYRQVGAPAAYLGQFYPGPHKFDLDMQGAAFAWLQEQLT